MRQNLERFLLKEAKAQSFSAEKNRGLRLYFTVYLIFLYSDGERDLKRLNILLK